MREAIVSTKRVGLTPDGNAVEVTATLDAGEVTSGMFVLIPLNRDASVAALTSEREVLPDCALRLVLDCNGDAEDAELVAGLNFADETLWVVENLRP